MSSNINKQPCNDLKKNIGNILQHITYVNGIDVTGLSDTDQEQLNTEIIEIYKHIDKISAKLLAINIQQIFNKLYEYILKYETICKNDRFCTEVYCKIHHVDNGKYNIRFDYGGEYDYGEHKIDLTLRPTDKNTVEIYSVVTFSNGNSLTRITDININSDIADKLLYSMTLLN